MDTTQKNAPPARRPKPQGTETPRKRPQERPAGERQIKRPPEGKKSAPSQERRPRQEAEKRRQPARPQRRKQEPDDTLGSKPRAYGKTKPPKKSGLSTLGGGLKKAVRHSKAKAKARKTAKGHASVPTPAVIYTEPKTFNRRRFAIQMLSVAAVVAALVLGMSVFFKVENITVSGAEVYSAWAVREASGIQEGDNLLSFGNVRAAAKIKTNLPYVNRVRVGIKLPDTVNIIIEEEDVVYAIKSQDELWWLITSDGKVVEQTNGGKASGYTQILGVTLDTPVPRQKAVATEFITAETAAAEPGAEETAPRVVTGAQRLKAALEIVTALEANDIVGAAASVDVSQLENIVLWYGSRYQVKLGDSANLPYKVDCMNDAILQMSEYQSGYLDLSFTIWPDKVVYTPFS